MKIFKKLGAEAILTIMVLPFVIWVVTSIYSLKSEAQVTTEKVSRTLAIEAKVDYIYQYLIENKKGK